MANLEEREQNIVKARSVLERARLKNPKNDHLWMRSIQLEKTVSSSEIADRILSRAMQECPASGRLWAEAIESAIRPARKTKSIDALKKCEHDPYMLSGNRKRISNFIRNPGGSTQSCPGAGILRLLKFYSLSFEKMNFQNTFFKKKAAKIPAPGQLLFHRGST